MCLRFIQNGSHCILNISLINGTNNEACKIEHYKGVFCVHVAVDVVLPYSLRPRSVERYGSPTIDVALPGAEIEPGLPWSFDSRHGPCTVVGLNRTLGHDRIWMLLFEGLRKFNETIGWRECSVGCRCAPSKLSYPGWQI